MNGQPAPLPVCSLVLPAVFLFCAVVALVRGLNASEPSRRLAGVSLFCGLTAFAFFETVLGLTAHEHQVFFRAAGVVRLVLGFVGIVWGIRALRRRRLDHGTGITRPVAGVLLSVLQVGVGGFLLMVTGSAFAPQAFDPATAWVYRHPDHGFEITLPSAGWKEVRGPKGEPFFAHNLPRMHAAIFGVEPAATESDFRRSVQRMNAVLGKDPDNKASMRSKEGENAHGHKFAYATFVEQHNEGPVFVASALTWCDDRRLVVHVMFEGSPRLASRLGKAEESHTIETCAESICLSVK